MHTLRKIEKGTDAGKWEVGYWRLFASWSTESVGCTDTDWITISGPHDLDEAARRVNYLNGGHAPPFIPMVES